MRTERKMGSRAFVNQFMVYALVAICGSASIGLGTVWMRHQISLAANANKVLEASIGDLERRIEETDAAIAAEQDPAVLNRRNIEWHLGLVAPGETQVQRVVDDPVARLARIQNRKLFGEGPATVNLRVALAH
jgi:hypothetical protein